MRHEPIVAGEPLHRQLRYTAVAIILHWLIAASIIANLLSGALMNGWLRSLRQGLLPVHESVGMAVLLFSAGRLVWRLMNPPPPLDPRLSGQEKVAAHAVHALLYLMMFGMPLVGWALTSAFKRSLDMRIMIFGDIPLPRIEPLAQLPQPLKETVHTSLDQAHAAGAWVLLSLLIVHVAGALKHQFLDRHPQFGRMWLGKSAAASTRL